MVAFFSLAVYEVLIAGWTAQLQATMPQAAVHPSAQEVGEMAQRAGEVVRLLEELRRMSLGGMEERGKGVEVSAGSADGGRPPKRPWEDLGRDVDDVRVFLLFMMCG